jgi:protein-L-isoaspartate(D-aspartate) O-methyltransferase
MQADWVLVGLLGLFCVSCAAGRQDDEKAFDEARRQMVETLRRRYGVTDERVLAAMLKVRRHVYIPGPLDAATAYGDHPWSIGHDQTISQPFIVAHMTERMNVKPGEKVLEIGTGSGYQAAVLAEMGSEVYSIEIIPELAEHARRVLKAEGYERVHVLAGDGYKGWPDHQPFDVVVVTCAPEEVPKALVDQMAEGGRMIVPVGAGFQRLVTLRKKNGRIIHEEGIFVRFVPMVGGEKTGQGAR